MCSGGRILRQLKAFLPSPYTTVMIVGYQSTGTLGRSLVDGASAVRINGEEVKVKAAVETLGGFSAHADREGLLSWARAVPGKEIQWLVNHGEKKAATSLAEIIEKEGLGVTTVAEKGLEIVG